MAMATAMWHSGRNPLKKIANAVQSRSILAEGTPPACRLHRAFLRYHDPDNWPLLREALKAMGRSDLIGNSKRHLVPSFQPAGTGAAPEGTRTPGNDGQQRPLPHPADPACAATVRGDEKR